MCDCEHLEQSINKLADRVTGYADSLQMAPTDNWEYSAPVFVGGVTGSYKVRAPFMGDCQFTITSAITGHTAAAAFAVILVSPYPRTSNVGMLATSQSYAENSPLDGIVISLPDTMTIPFSPFWYNVGSDSLVYVLVTFDVIAGVNLQFRQKRK